MKILVDMNLSPEWVSVLQEAGYKALHWSNIGSLNAPDREVLSWAKANGYLLFTHTLTSGQSLLPLKPKDRVLSKSGHKTSLLTTQRICSSTSSINFPRIFFKGP